MRVLDLFSGIGGFSLGLERAGMTTVAFCEIEPYCRAVLKKHWPEVPCYDDVRSLTYGRLAADGICVDVICGGFPCQDISVAGKGAGIEGERSGLWGEYSRLIGELRPRYAIMENVAALLGRGMDVVLGDLASLGYDAEWHCIPASAVGAPHRRDRVWIVAYPACERRRKMPQRKLVARSQSNLAMVIPQEPGPVANANRPRLAIWESLAGNDGTQQPAAIGGGWWSSEPSMGRVAHGVSGRVDRITALGNAVVPQIPEMIARAILAMEAKP
jgi:DNA (cytosine-5)-methyltransferase 1